MTLAEAIVKAQSEAQDPPQNESNTCNWIILPLLQATYETRDIDSQGRDNAGKFPDYTVLPNSGFTWYLEAKAWNVALADSHAQQALNYANNNGRRFVVLTNGRTWSLYDNSIQGLPPDKLIKSVALADTESFTALMNALSKMEVMKGGLERLSESKQQEALEQKARLEREKEAERVRARQAEILNLLRSTLPVQLGDAESEVVQSIALYLREKEGFQDILPETVSQWFKEAVAPPPQNKVKRKAQSGTQQEPLLVSNDSNGAKTLNLEELAGNTQVAKSTKPVALCLPNGKKVPISHWVDFAGQSVIYLSQQLGSLPLPFGEGTKCWFLNHEPKHKNGETYGQYSKSIVCQEGMVYMNTLRNVDQFIRHIHALCLATGVPPEGFRITFRG